MAKVILVDNFDRDTVSDQLLQDGLTEEEANKMADDYNAAHTPNSPYFARAVPDDHKLYDAFEGMM